MKFLLFICCLWAMGWFHRREHLRDAAALRDVQKTLSSLPPDKDALKTALAGQDWRLVSLTPRHAVLKRAFQVERREDMLRYGMPLVFLAVLLIALQGWGIAAVYAAVLAVKWFALTTAVTLSPYDGRYDVSLFGIRLFGEYLSPP
jgi:hypothetical protein